MTARPKAPGPASRAYVRWLLRHGFKLWIVALAVGVPALAATVGLYARLSSDIEQLLPRDAPSVRAIDELRARMPGLQYLGVIVDAGDAARLPAAERLLDDLAARVRSYPPALVRAVKTDATAERQFIERHAALYAELDDLRAIRERIAERKRWETAQKLDLAIDDAPAPPLDFEDITRKYEERTRAAGRLPQGRFSSAAPALSLMLVEVGGYSTGADRARELLSRVKGDLAALGGPDRYAPGMRIGFGGDVAVSVEEISALEADLTLASLLVLAAVILVIWVYFRWWRSIVILFPPLILATAGAFGLASLPPFNVTELNSNTAFLGSIIIGNGINFGILLLARYVEARRRGAAVEEALVEAVWGARLGTLVAALAAGVAYASLILTQFRGFRQFGIIGGIGMVLCWAASFVLIPPLVAWLDRGARAAPRPRPARRGLMQPFARFVAAHPTGVIMAGAVITAASVLAAARIDAGRIETDFARLRRRDTWTQGEGYWGRKMDQLLGRYLSPTVLLADSPEEARVLAMRLREAARKPPLDALVSEVRSLDSVLPQDQPEKLAELQKIRRLLSPVTRAQVDPARLAQVDRLLGDSAPSPITAAALPAVFTTGLREHGGELGRAVLVFPTLSKRIWQGDNLDRYVGELRRIVDEVAGELRVRPARVAGALPLSSDIVSSIRRDGPLASLAALAGVVSLVVVMFRWSPFTAFIVGSLGLGVLWLAGAIVGLGVRINFVNFIAFPITFGIGVDYAVNVISRYLQDGTGDIEQPIRSTGAAVGLCSATTIIGYSSLLLAQNQGLFLFGLLAVLGEITCLLTALAVLPAGLVLWERRRRRPEAVRPLAAE